MFKLKTIEKALVIGVLFTSLFSLTGFANKCDDISTKVLRLHILANSDSETDQDLKIKVRDKIIEKSSDFLNGAKNKIDAKNCTLNNIQNIKKIAEEEIKRQGFNYPVHIELTDMYFPTRQYGQRTLPAGHYDALRILIGSGKGHNWWCVIFPQMCLSSAKYDTAEDSVLTDSEKDVINSGEKYEIKFKVVDWFYSLKSCISNWFN